jgi:hypothetical protein
MASASRSRNDGRFDSVIRSFQPSRIEHELLAQIYDIAHRGFEGCSERLIDLSTAMDEVSPSRSLDLLQDHANEPRKNEDAHAMEAVA